MKDPNQPEPSTSEGAGSNPVPPGYGRYIGIDAGAETIKMAELFRDGGGFRVGRRIVVEHDKQPGATLLKMLADWDWRSAHGAAVTGRFAGQVNLARIPSKQAQLSGYRFRFGEQPATVVNIGSHGFSVLEIREHGLTMFRENSRCSQGTGNFLRQLVERFSLTVDEAGRLAADVQNPAPLSGRCPVILKTDMTHLANKGEDRARILAGLFDAVCENVLVLLKPGASPPRVLLTGGVSRSPRVRRVFGEALARQGMELIASPGEESLYLEALGAAVLASNSAWPLPSDANLVLPPRELKLERLPALVDSLPQVRRMPSQAWPVVNGEVRRLVLGFDLGSTGAKLVAMDAGSGEVLWEGYRQTLGDPVGAAQDLLRRFTGSTPAKFPVLAVGVTGSGREVAGSLLTSCYGKEAVFIVNEIVAHATGALRYDPRVDTIFEIGGQDAKYIRLAEGRIVDCAMNEACSAGTGSFIEEQGRKFSGIQDVRQLGEAALAAKSGVSLGQHCSVFMAEVLDEGVAAGIDQPTLISGLYDSIIKNYLNRVKGNRSVGKVIFCQGMPFTADALAAAVARQTGSEVVVPPNPGNVGALGIAMLATRELDLARLEGLDLGRFLTASVEQKDSFVCRATTGCGGAGNRCRIERLRTLVVNQRSQFTWGGGCALHDKATRKQKLPDLAPDPFRERDDLLQTIIGPFTAPRGNPCVAMADEFMLKGLFPFFAAFFHRAGFDLKLAPPADQAVLKRGIQSAMVPFCAPMQLFHGVAEKMAAAKPDWIFVPMLTSVPRPEDQRCSVVCPIVQAAPDVLGSAVRKRSNGATDGQKNTARIFAPLLRFDGGVRSEGFRTSCLALAAELRLDSETRAAAWQAGLAAQLEFDAGCLQIGSRALKFCREHDIVAVIVLGRNYTIYNRVLNSNVPAILREQGAIGIPVDAYPVGADIPQFPDMYWGYGQSLLRAAHQVRRDPGVYALYCSNYSCGPDSFNLHYAAYVMEGKPFAIIETDGHTGDAGTKTRVEAFLHCVHEDRRSRCLPPANDFRTLQFGGLHLRAGRQNGSAEKLLVPSLGLASKTVAAVFRGLRLDAEALPDPDAESMRRGRRYTSGKECLPMPLTLGTLLQRLESAKTGEHFVYVMPSTDGPCRFGVYNLLNQVVLEKLGLRERVRIWSPKDSGYFDDLPPGTEMLMLAGFVANDLLLQAKLDVRPFEMAPGAAEAIHQRRFGELLRLLEAAGLSDLTLGRGLWQVLSGGLFGIRDLLREAAAEFAAVRGAGDRPVVELTGEIYVRTVDFSNDFLIRKLEARGLRVRLAPQTEWVSYCTYLRRHEPGRNRLADGLSERLQHRIEETGFRAMGPVLGWPVPPSVQELLDTAKPYLNPELRGEAVLTIGASLRAWRRAEMDAVISVGPLECMPTKIAEAQFQRLAEQEGLLSLTLAFNGEPVSDATLDNFAFEVLAAYERRKNKAGALAPRSCRTNGPSTRTVAA